MVEPIIINVGAGVAGAFTTQITPVIGSWLRSRFSGHTDEAVHAARDNSKAFIINLSNRLQKLEDSDDTEAGFSERLSEAMKNPDVAAAFQDALYSSARTNDSQKHDLLSRAITERMLADEDGVQALATNQALSVIPRLHSRHLENLGLAALFFAVRPKLDSHTTKDQFEAKIGGWLDQSISHYLPVDPMTFVDAQHLVANGCVSYQASRTKSLRNVLLPIEFDESVWSEGGYFDSESGKTALEVWDQFATHCDMTSVGSVIGIYVHDSKLGIRTKFNW